MNDCSVIVDLQPAVTAARQALAQTSYGWLQRVEVVLEAGRLVLRGEVPSFYLKQLAQVAVLALPDVPGLRNELRVTSGV
ncbi:BON domain-containing protein [Urbifossiella limnaea]|nr:BON domain-containing protein [Urbifossiella limnaea]